MAQKSSSAGNYLLYDYHTYQRLRFPNFIRLIYPIASHKASIASIYFPYDYHTEATRAPSGAPQMRHAAQQKFVLVVSADFRARKNPRRFLGEGFRYRLGFNH